MAVQLCIKTRFYVLVRVKARYGIFCVTLSSVITSGYINSDLKMVVEGSSENINHPRNYTVTSQMSINFGKRKCDYAPIYVCSQSLFFIRKIFLYIVSSDYNTHTEARTRAASHLNSVHDFWCAHKSLSRYWTLLLGPSRLSPSLIFTHSLDQNLSSFTLIPLLFVLTSSLKAVAIQQLSAGLLTRLFCTC